VIQRSHTRHAVKAFHALTIPRRVARALGLLVFLVAIPLVHGVLPWAISLFGYWYGWVDGRPALWNLLGLLPVSAGVIVLVWLLVLGLSLGSELPERVELDWSPKVFIARGPYAVSRHPMYLAEIGLWLGWSILFGSVAVLLGCLLVCIGAGIVAPREELALELKFGAAYRQYKATVPRWLGQRWA
jgi:protein-S-isoprenylcysteine O-methyltransferase Ste14